MKTQTLVTSLGRNPKLDHGSVNPPIHRTSTLVFDSFRQMKDYEAGKTSLHGYGRHGNDTMQRLADAIAQLEGADASFITCSGLAATILAIQSCVSAGDHILVLDSIYSCTRKFVEKELTRTGVEITFYDPTIGAGIEALMKPNTKAIYTESPGSLTFEMQDIPAIVAVAHTHGALVIGDNTWATPLHMRPFDLGIDISVQSVTKYIAGHSDLVMGSVSCKANLAPQIKRVYLNTGVCAAADNIYLALRGLRSMAVRLREHEKAGIAIASWLEQQPQVARVLYPALPSDPGHALFKRDLTGACGLFAFEMKDATEAKVEAFVDALHHFGLGYSWGGYESLVTAYRPSQVRSATQWADDCWLIRLNIGLEDVEDLKEDLAQALAKSAKA